MRKSAKGSAAQSDDLWASPWVVATAAWMGLTWALRWGPTWAIPWVVAQASLKEPKWALPLVLLWAPQWVPPWASSWDLLSEVVQADLMDVM